MKFNQVVIEKLYLLDANRDIKILEIVNDLYFFLNFDLLYNMPCQEKGVGEEGRKRDNFSLLKAEFFDHVRYFL